MKPIILWLLIPVLLFTACGMPIDADNEITDSEGLLIELTWTNSATNPTTKADLELYVRQNYTSLLYSKNYNDFEEVEITPGLLNGGDYNIDVYVDDVDIVTNYTLTFTGKSTGKTYSQKFGPINANDNNTTLKPLSINISGNKYRVY